jgi:hypothetical protein
MKMPGKRGFFYRAAAILLIGMMMVPSSGQMRTGPGFHSTMPAGYTVVRLEPSGAVVSFLGLIECPEIEGAQQVSQGLSAKVVDSHGVPLRTFPRHVSFRITATLKKTLIDPPLDSVTSTDIPAQFLLKLGFRLKIYHGLERREAAPESVTMIGVPPDVAYDERVFRVSFDLADLPVTDRVVLEIVSPDDEVITHFSFGML